jgi:hypothetical protein
MVTFEFTSNVEQNVRLSVVMCTVSITIHSLVCAVSAITNAFLLFLCLHKETEVSHSCFFVLLNQINTTGKTPFLYLESSVVWMEADCNTQY